MYTFGQSNTADFAEEIMSKCRNVFRLGIIFVQLHKWNKSSNFFTVSTIPGWFNGKNWVKIKSKCRNVFRLWIRFVQMREWNKSSKFIHGFYHIWLIWQQKLGKNVQMCLQGCIIWFKCVNGAKLAYFQTRSIKYGWFRRRNHVKMQKCVSIRD